VVEEGFEYIVGFAICVLPPSWFDEGVPFGARGEGRDVGTGVG